MVGIALFEAFGLGLQYEMQNHQHNFGTRDFPIMGLVI